MIKALFSAAVNDFYDAVGRYLLEHQTHLLQGSARAMSHHLAPFKRESTEAVLRNGMRILSGGDKVSAAQMMHFCQAINGRVSPERRWQSMISRCRVGPGNRARASGQAVDVRPF